ncbi:ABC transporter permease [Candidatus Bipolaricaulota bacterium]|nr:ABC transporter permease [Candidatus Bipolaricaulota bacterium]
MTTTWWEKFTNLTKYPSLIAGLTILLALVSLSIFAVSTMPYQEAIRLWRGGQELVKTNPKRVPPAWFDWFTRDDLPRTLTITEQEGTKTVQSTDEGRKKVKISLPFKYDYDRFPSEINLFTETSVEERITLTVRWRAPDGEEMTLTENRRIRGSDTYYISQDMNLRMKLEETPHKGLLSGADPSRDEPIKGDYEVIFEGEVPEGESLEAELVLYGQVHGLAGTDHKRRNLMVALLWGAPIGLAFGVLGAVGAYGTTFVLAGIGTWFGGIVDSIFQRLTELSMILPGLVLYVMVGYFLSRSLWVLLGMVILKNVFSAGMKTYRSVYLQEKESSYIEAAQAYGASDWRIIFRYLLPRVAPMLLPSFVNAIPTFVYLEATLAVIGLGDPVLPTWGKIIYDARVNGALYMGDYYWMILPAVLLILTGFGFALIGYTMDRVVNPRLRER